MKNQTIEVELSADCPVPDELPPGILRTMQVIGGKWKIPLLWLLWRRTRRFGELRRALPGVTQHMLTASLRELEAEGLVSRTVFAEVPPRVEYALTSEGQSLGTVFGALKDWGEQRTLR
jgi:DNA-binding HxlR family transcriptional regulator